MSTDTSSKPTVTTAAAASTKTSVVPPKPAQPSPASTTQATKPADSQPKEEPKVVNAKYKSEDYDGAPIVKLKLKQAGIMQYDAWYKLKLDSTEPTELPLTPFFAERLNRTIELCI